MAVIGLLVLFLRYHFVVHWMRCKGRTKGRAKRSSKTEFKEVYRSLSMYSAASYAFTDVEGKLCSSRALLKEQCPSVMRWFARAFFYISCLGILERVLPIAGISAALSIFL